MADLEDLLEGAGLKEKWIQEAVKSMKKGAFTKQSLRHGMTPKDYAAEVLAHPEGHTAKTRRRAQFVENVRARVGKGKAQSKIAPDPTIGYSRAQIALGREAARGPMATKKPDEKLSEADWKEHQRLLRASDSLREAEKRTIKYRLKHEHGWSDKDLGARFVLTGLPKAVFQSVTREPFPMPEPEGEDVTSFTFVRPTKK